MDYIPIGNIRVLRFTGPVPPLRGISLSEPEYLSRPAGSFYQTLTGVTIDDCCFVSHPCKRHKEIADGRDEGRQAYEGVQGLDQGV
jgi:hypothetical protein